MLIFNDSRFSKIDKLKVIAYKDFEEQKRDYYGNLISEKKYRRTYEWYSLTRATAQKINLDFIKKTYLRVARLGLDLDPDYVRSVEREVNSIFLRYVATQ